MSRRLEKPARCTSNSSTEGNLPYGRQLVDEDDIGAVTEVLRSDWLTTGPKIGEFEERFREFVGAKEAVAVSSGTAALHAAMHAIGVGPNDEVIVPAMTFVATANCIAFQGGTPVFVDVTSENLLIDPEEVEAKLTSRTKAIIAVDYAGHPCEYETLRKLAAKHGLVLIADACHSLGGSYRGKPVGSLADLSTFSFHPVKAITAGEGGMVTTDDPSFARRLRLFRNHGITSDSRDRDSRATWFYEMVDLGYNYRLTDFQCALAESQLKKLAQWIVRRQEIARAYDAFFTRIPSARPLRWVGDISHAYHLYVVRLDLSLMKVDRAIIFELLRADGIRVGVHYIPVHLHPYYQMRFGTRPGMCPVAESSYEEILSLPIFPGMTEEEVERVISAVERVLEAHAK